MNNCQPHWVNLCKIPWTSSSFFNVFLFFSCLIFIIYGLELLDEATELVIYSADVLVAEDAEEL